VWNVSLVVLHLLVDDELLLLSLLLLDKSSHSNTVLVCCVAALSFKYAQSWAKHDVASEPAKTSAHEHD